MKRLCLLLLLIILLAMPAGAYASDISDADYYGVIRVTNNSTEDSFVSTTCNISTADLIEDDFLNSSANNCVVRSSAGSDIPFQPSVNATLPWYIWVNYIGTSSIINDVLYTADSSGGLIRYFPGLTGMETSDADNMEPGANFTFITSGWVDTSAGSDKNLIYKQGAFTCNISGAENITSTIPEYNPNSTLSPIAAGAETNCDLSGAATNWQAVLTDDGDTSYVYTAAGWKRDLYDMAQVTPAWGTINNVTVYAVTKNSAAGLSGLKIVVRTHATTYETAAKAITTNYVTYSEVYAVNPNTAAAWTWDEVNAMECGVSLDATGSGGQTRTTHVYAIVNVTSPLTSVTATGITPGDYEVKTMQSAGLDFVSTDVDYCEVLYFADLNQANISVELWFYKDDASDDTLIGRYYSQDWWIHGGTNIAMHAHIGGSLRGNWVTTAGGTISANTWYHFVWTYDGTTAHIYLNGQDMPITQTHTGALNTTAARLWIGKRYDDSNSPFDGIIDDVRYYGRELSPTEVTEHYAGIFNNETDLIAHWAMDDFAGATLTDTSGNGHHGTISGANWHMGALKLYLDDTLEDITTGAIVQGNANDWYIGQNDGMPYIEYYQHYVNDDLRQHIIWEYNDTTFSDLSAYGNDATPSFRSASSNANVTALLDAFYAISEATAPAYTLDDAVDFIDDNITTNVTGTFTTTPPTTAGFPLAGVISTVATATSTPPQLPLLIIAAFVILALSLSTSYTMRKYGSGSLLVKIFVIIGVMGIFVALKNFGVDFWLIPVFAIIATAIAFASKQIGFA